jgi:hypothetical protein
MCSSKGDVVKGNGEKPLISFCDLNRLLSPTQRFLILPLAQQQVTVQKPP